MSRLLSRRELWFPTSLHRDLLTASYSCLFIRKSFIYRFFTILTCPKWLFYPLFTLARLGNSLIARLSTSASAAPTFDHSSKMLTPRYRKHPCTAAKPALYLVCTAKHEIFFTQASLHFHSPNHRLGHQSREG